MPTGSISVGQDAVVQYDTVNRKYVTMGTDWIGGKHPTQPYRQFALYQKDFTSVEQNAPIPLVYGTVKLSGTAITPVWNFSATATKTRAGK